jgi:hypothetical protein
MLMEGLIIRNIRAKAGFTSLQILSDLLNYTTCRYYYNVTVAIESRYSYCNSIYPYSLWTIVGT